MINRIVRSALVAASSILLLGGCAGIVTNVYAPERISALAPEEGRVILSVGAPVGCFISTTALHISPYGQVEWFRLRNGISVDHMAIRSDFPDHQGTVSVLNLRPGRYQVVTESENPYFASTQAPRYQFVLRPGENLYIGSFLMAQACARETSVAFVDQSRRDLPIVFARNPLFDPSSVTVRIAEPDGYALGGPRTAGSNGPVDNRRWDAPAPLIAARPPAPPPIAPARPFDTTVAAVAQAAPVPSEAEYQGPPVIVTTDRVVAYVQHQARTLLHGQADRLSPPGRAALVAQFDRSLEASTPYIARRLDASTGGSDTEIVVSVARHAWLVGCSRLDASLTGECERQRGAAEAELSAILAGSATSSTL